MKSFFRARLHWKFTRAALAGLGLLALAGCSSPQKKAEPAFKLKSTGGQTNVVVASAGSPVGRVASVNAQARFAVVNFPVGQVPANETRLGIFRAGAKVGVLKISGPAADNFTVGDIIDGSAQDGDEVRAEQ